MSASHRRRRHGGGGFARRDALHNWSLHFGPNMTPMVDIVMVILIFFMTSAAFVGSDWFLKAALPTEPGKGAPQKRDPLELPPTRINVIMELDQNGRTVCTFLDLNKAPVEAAVARFSGMPKGPETASFEVIIKPGAPVPYRDIVRVHESVLGAGITKVGIGVGSR